jgi:Cu/Ag efflux pump CusA
MNVSLDRIEQAIQSNNANIPAERLKYRISCSMSKPPGLSDDLEQIRNTVVGSYEGRIVYLKT